MKQAAGKHWHANDAMPRHFFEAYNTVPPEHPNTDEVKVLLNAPREFFLRQLKELKLSDKYVRPASSGMEHPIGKYDIPALYDYLREHSPEELGMAMRPFTRLLGSKDSSFVRPKLAMEELCPGEKTGYQIKDSMAKENGVTSFKVVNNDPGLVDVDRPFCHYTVDKDDAYLASEKYGGGAWGVVKDFPSVPGMLSKKINKRLHVYANLPKKRKLAFTGPVPQNRRKAQNHTVRFGHNTTPRGTIHPKVDGIFQRVVANGEGCRMIGRNGNGLFWNKPSVNVDIETEQILGSNELYLTTVRKMPFPNYWGYEGMKYFLDKYELELTMPGGERVKVTKIPEFDADYIANCPYDGIVVKIGDLEFAYKFRKQADLDADSYDLAVEAGWIVDQPPQGVAEYNFGYDTKEDKITLTHNRQRPDKPRGNHWNNIKRMPFDPDAYQVLEEMEADGTLTTEQVKQIIHGYEKSQRGEWDAVNSVWKD
jgi:hypothetical protein